MHRNMFGAKRKTASRRPIRNPIRCFDQVASILQKHGARREWPQLGSCLTAATRESRSRRAVRVFPLCYRPSVCDSNYRGMLTRWCHESPPCLLQRNIVRLAYSTVKVAANRGGLSGLAQTCGVLLELGRDARESVVELGA